MKFVIALIGKYFNRMLRIMRYFARARVFLLIKTSYFYIAFPTVIILLYCFAFDTLNEYKGTNMSSFFEINQIKTQNNKDMIKNLEHDENKQVKKEITTDSIKQ